MSVNPPLKKAKSVYKISALSKDKRNTLAKLWVYSCKDKEKKKFFFSFLEKEKIEVPM